MERAKTSGRVDDNAAVLLKRYRQYEEEVCAIVDLYRDQGLVRDIDGTRDPDAVFADVIKLFADL